MYIGIYPVGPRSKTSFRKTGGGTCSFLAMTPEEYIASEMVYPSGLLEKNVSGYALCEFTIDKEGVILRPHILRSTHPEFAEEALRIVKGMPKWSPAWWEESRRIVITLFMFLSVRNSIGINKQLCI